jgi:dissimilatory sulfite reductase (desulfoviridin) alpha/beta subunit
MDGKTLKIDNKECTRCMHCINVMPRALRIGDDRGLSVFAGAKAPILDGAQMGTLVVPFIEAEAPYTKIKETVIEPLWDWWMEEGKNRERMGELMKRQGLQKVIEVLGVDPDPRMVQEPRSNPYIFWKEEEVEGGFDRDINEFRKHHRDRRGLPWLLFLQDTIPEKPMENRITDIGPRKYDEFYPPVIAKNKGKWLYHEILQPGVLVHVAKSGDEVYTVRCGGARLMTTSMILEICEIADKHCGGFVRWTTRNNIEFMVDNKAKVKPLLDDLASRKFPADPSSSRSAAPAPASPTSCTPRAGFTATPRPPMLPDRSRRSWTSSSPISRATTCRPRCASPWPAA